VTRRRKKRARLKTVRRQHSLQYRYEQPPAARRRNERKNKVRGVPGNERAEREIEVRVEKKEENILRHHPNEKRNTGRIHHPRKETLVPRRILV